MGTMLIGHARVASLYLATTQNRLIDDQLDLIDLGFLIRLSAFS
jgi:hypothetical protein